ncbi:MAG TPA: hypothetical protein VN151_07440, partial [Terracidiphilus sp.]|nr:hypothetical protein [Terracidiphilus sp.]
MHTFRLRLIVALVACVTAVSAAFTYFEVLAHKHFLRADLMERSRWIGLSLQPGLEQSLASGLIDGLPDFLRVARGRVGVQALVVYDAQGQALASSGPNELIEGLNKSVLKKALDKGMNASAFGHTGDAQWLEQAVPLHSGRDLEGALVLVSDANYIRTESNAVWQRSFGRTAALVVLVTLIT